MNKDLLPIIAAHWGAECSYELNFESDKWVHESQLIDAVELSMAESDCIRNFKLHLRTLSSITKAELLALGKALNYSNPIAVILPERSYVSNESGTISVSFHSNYPYQVMADFDAVETVDWLRKNNFCVNKKLVDAGLVEWKEVKP